MKSYCKRIAIAAVIGFAGASLALPVEAFAATADPKLTADDITDGANGTWHDDDGSVVNWSFDDGNLELSGDDAWVFELSFENNITQVKSITWKIDYSQVRGSVSDSQYYIASRFPNLETFKVESSKATSFTPYCFNGCKKLSKVDLSEATGITTLSSAGIFLGCESLKALDLSKTSITTIEQGPFSGSCLESITLPEDLTTLGTNALADCGQEQGKGTYGDAEKGIKSIVIPPTVTSIGQSAFSNLLGLKVVYLPVGITSFNTSQDTTAKASADHSEPTFSKEYVVYGSESTDDPTWVTTLKNAWAKNTSMHKETFSYPSGVVAQIEAAAAVTSAKDMTTDIAKGLLSARTAYTTLSDLAKAAPGLENVDWDAVYVKSDAAMKVLGEALVSGSGIDDAQMNAVAAIVAEYCNAQAQKELDAYKAQAQKQYDELKAQTAQQSAEWQDEAASLKVKGASKVVKLKKAKKTKKAAKVKLKLANSASGTVATVAKAKGGSKFITVGADGKVVLKKGVKKGTYKAKVTVTYGKHSATVTVKFTVK